MSAQKIQTASAILTTQTPYTIEADTAGQPVPSDITKLILANSSVSNCQVTVSDGVNNYYYVVPAGGTVIDKDLMSDGGDIALNLPASKSWTVTLGAAVSSIYVTAVFN